MIEIHQLQKTNALQTSTPLWDVVSDPSVALYLYSLQSRHNERDGVSNHQRLDCLLTRLFSCRSKKISKLRVTGLCDGNPPETVGFTSQRSSNAENVFIWWRHHVRYISRHSSHSRFIMIVADGQTPVRRQHIYKHHDDTSAYQECPNLMEITWIKSYFIIYYSIFQSCI